jgi:hypothetical protein
VNAEGAACANVTVGDNNAVNTIGYSKAEKNGFTDTKPIRRAA